MLSVSISQNKFLFIDSINFIKSFSSNSISGSSSFTIIFLLISTGLDFTGFVKEFFNFFNSFKCSNLFTNFFNFSCFSGANDDWRELIIWFCWFASKWLIKLICFSIFFSSSLKKSLLFSKSLSSKCFFKLFTTSPNSFLFNSFFASSKLNSSSFSFNLSIIVFTFLINLYNLSNCDFLNSLLAFIFSLFKTSSWSFLLKLFITFDISFNLLLFSWLFSLASFLVNGFSFSLNKSFSKSFIIPLNSFSLKFSTLSSSCLTICSFKLIFFLFLLNLIFVSFAKFIILFIFFVVFNNLIKSFCLVLFALFFSCSKIIFCSFNSMLLIEFKMLPIFSSTLLGLEFLLISLLLLSMSELFI